MINYDDSVGYVDDQSFINNRLLDILNNHIIVDNINGEEPYYLSKGGSHINIEGYGNGIKIRGGGDIVNNTYCQVDDGNYFDQENGETYFIDKLIQTPIRSTYSVLLEDSLHFGEFFNLCNEFPAGSEYEVFVRRSSFYGVDYSIKFFNTFNYTVWVPTNEAIRKAIKDGVIVPWNTRTIDGVTIKGIYDMANDGEINNEERLALIEKMGRFIRYHFQDNSVLLDGVNKNASYTSATLKTDNNLTYLSTYRNKYYKLHVDSDGSDISITCESDLVDKNGDEIINDLDRQLTSPRVVNLVKDDNRYNLIVRDYIFNNDPRQYNEIDDMTNGYEYENSRIYTSSTAVINQIDDILTFE